MPLHVVTGAFGYTGRAIARRLLGVGVEVRTLTNSPNRPNPFAGRIEVHPFHFDSPGALERSLRGADVLYNTYWVRFNHRLFSFDQAMANTRTLFDAARRAGVGRIVHVSILNADRAPHLAYYRGKAALERALKETGVPHSILRPGVIFGRGDILINNIAWALRRLPVFGVFGDGRYPIRPVHVDDMADLAVAEGGERGDRTIDAVGPESFAFGELVRALARIIGVRRAIVSVPPALGYAVIRAINPFVRDVIITREEIAGLMAGLLGSDAPATGGTRLTEWARRNREALGRRYAGEIARRIDRALAVDAAEAEQTP